VAKMCRKPNKAVVGYGIMAMSDTTLKCEPPLMSSKETSRYSVLGGCSDGICFGSEVG
jgi:hypothetical protein